jgi:hypothetical protein
MAIQLVGTASANKVAATSGNSTLSLSSLSGGLAAAPSTGDLVIAVFVSQSISTDPTLSISDGTTEYTLLGSELHEDDSNDTNLRVAYKFMGGSPDTDVTFGPTGTTTGYACMAVAVFRGVASIVNDVAVTTATGANGGQPDPPAITPVTAGAVIVAIGAAASDTISDFNATGMTGIEYEKVSVSDGTALAIATDTWTSGAYNPAAWTGGSTATTASWAALTLALRPAPGVSTATETDTALALTAVQQMAVGRADETDTALALTAGIVVGQATETDTALALAPVQQIAVGRASETDAALQLYPFPVPPTTRTARLLSSNILRRTATLLRG